MPRILRSIFIFPLAVGLVAGLASAHWQVAVVDPKDAITVFGTLSQIACTLLGFLLAALAVLASINATHLVKMMKRTGHYSDLLLTMFVGCVAFLFCALLSITVLFGVVPTSNFLGIVIGANVAALVSLLDGGRKFWMVLKNLQSE